LSLGARELNCELNGVPQQKMASHVNGLEGEVEEKTENVNASAEVESASSTGGSSFVSGVLPGVREASRKLQLKMSFRTLASPKRAERGELII